MPRIALTGGIASGKSTVSTMLAELGAVIIDADLLAREVVEPGTDGYAAVVATFGEAVVGSDGALDRPALGAVVFADAEKRRELEAIIHPLVLLRGQQIEAEAPPEALVVHDIPLLAESRGTDGFAAVLVVDVPVEVQVERMVRERDMSEDEAWSRVRAQASREERLKIATHVIDNSTTREDLRQRVSEVFTQLRWMGRTSAT